MNRRGFIRNSVAGIALPMLLNQMPIRAFGKGSIFEAAIQGAKTNGKILVLIQLDGGNDGLNTVVPLDQYANLSNARKNILIPDKKILSLSDSAVTGLHPNMPGLQDMYNNKLLSIIQGVGVADQDFSHFRATDIKLTASDARTVLKTGWIGRLEDINNPGYPNGYPNADFPHPLAIKIGAEASTALQGQAANVGVVISSLANFKQLTTTTYDPVDDSPAGKNINYVRQITFETVRYLKTIKAASDAQKTLSKKYPEEGTNQFADQMRIIAQLIGGGLQTQIYMLTVGGFDTHNAQADSADPAKGQHARLLQMLSEGIAAFEDDLHLMGKQDQVVGMTFSEFGRRIISNASYGTDHGTSEPIFLFGSQVKPGLIGKNPVIPAKVKDSDNLDIQYDFRSVYASVLKGWLGVSDEALAKVMLGNFPALDLFKN